MAICVSFQKQRKAVLLLILNTQTGSYKTATGLLTTESHHIIKRHLMLLHTILVFLTKLYHWYIYYIYLTLDMLHSYFLERHFSIALPRMSKFRE